MQGYMRDSLLKTQSGRYQPHRPDCIQGRAPLVVYSMVGTCVNCKGWGVGEDKILLALYLVFLF